MKTSPVKTALECVRQLDYAGAERVLVGACRENPTVFFELGRIANLFQIGQTTEAVVALVGLELRAAEFILDPPADEDIGRTVPLSVEALAVC